MLGVRAEAGVRMAGMSFGCAAHFEHGGWNAGNGDFRQKFGDWSHLLGRFSTLANASASTAS